MIKKLLYVTLAFCILLANMYVPDVLAATDDRTFGQIKQELADFKQQYEDNKLQQELTAEERETTKENIRITEDNIMETQNDIAELYKEIDILNDNIAAKEQEIKDILAFYQISNGESAYLEYAFGAKTFTDFIYRAAISEQLTAYNNDLVEKYKKDVEASKKKTEELLVKVRELEVKQNELNAYLVKLGNDLQDLYDDSLSIESQIQLSEDLISTFEEMGCKDNETLDECAKNKIPQDNGFLRPLEAGYITGWSGYRGDIGISGTGAVHHGLDMSADGATSSDIPLYSIANGVVIAVYDTCGDGGRKVYIQHNVNGTLYISSYWHLRRIDVEKGDVVTKYTQIGLLGGNVYERGCSIPDTLTSGAHLHLEMSTANFDINNFWSYRSGWLNPEKFINVPSVKYQDWYNRTTRY